MFFCRLCVLSTWFLQVYHAFHHLRSFFHFVCLRDSSDRFFFVVWFVVYFSCVACRWKKLFEQRQFNIAGYFAFYRHRLGTLAQFKCIYVLAMLCNDAFGYITHFQLHTVYYFNNSIFFFAIVHFFLLCRYYLFNNVSLVGIVYKAIKMPSVYIYGAFLWDSDL